MAKQPIYTKKRRQHHVWQFYLKAWATDDKLTIRQDGAVREGGSVNVAVEKDFYKIEKPTDEDIALIRAFIIERSNPYAKALHENFLSLITKPIGMMEMLRPKLEKVEINVDDVIDTYLTNALEDHHGAIERLAIPLIESLRAGDTTFYFDEDGCISFLYYICNQYLRTKAIKVRTLQIKGLAPLGRVWDIVSAMAATNIGGSLFVERESRPIRVLRSTAETKFITGDQPVINLYTGDEAATKFSMYYPISPEVAIVIEEPKEKRFADERLSNEDILALNHKIVEAHHSQLFSSNRRSFEQLQL